MERGTCATCTFFEDVKNQCRLNPPTLVCIQQRFQDDADGEYLKPVYVSKWPTVDSDDWCSYWKSALVHGQRKTWNRQLNEQANNEN